MAKNTATTMIDDSYERLGRRIQRLIAAPGVQKTQVVTIYRNDDERLEDWNRLLDDIGETDGVQVEHLADGSVRIGWQRYIDV